MVPMLTKRAKRIVKKAREIVTPERCKECGAIFSARDISYGAWTHTMCKRCHGYAEQRHIEGWDRRVQAHPFSLNRHERRRRAMPVSRHRRYEQPLKTPRMIAA